MTRRPSTKSFPMRRWLAWILLLSLAGLAPLHGADDASVEAARALFERYQQLERRFDPELASLYDKDAVIWVTRVYSNGVVRELKIPGELYQMAIRQSREQAAEHGDFNEYSEVQFQPMDDGVKIQAQRFNLWRNYRSPYTAVVRPDAQGEWQIVEEHFETQVPEPASE